MFSIVEQGGFQYRVSEGDTVTVPHIDGEAGSEVTIDKVLLVHRDDATVVGTPHVEKAAVKGTIVEHTKGEKIRVIKKKRRKDYRRTNGHRQLLTTLKITSISA